VRGCGVNPYFVAYTRAHGHGADTEAMLDADRETWPGGKMAGFITWMSRRWGQWRELKRYRDDHALEEQDHRDFGAWLKEWARIEGARLEAPRSSEGSP